MTARRWGRKAFPPPSTTDSNPLHNAKLNGYPPTLLIPLWAYRVGWSSLYGSDTRDSSHGGVYCWAHVLLPDVRPSSSVAYAYAWWLQGKSNQSVWYVSAMARRWRGRGTGLDLDQSPHEIARWKGGPLASLAGAGCLGAGEPRRALSV